jgi:hypothetical protein
VFLEGKMGRTLRCKLNRNCGIILGGEKGGEDIYCHSAEVLFLMLCGRKSLVVIDII